MTLCRVVTVGGDVAFVGSAEDAVHYMRTHAMSDRVERVSDSVRLATVTTYSAALLFSLNEQIPAGSPRSPS